MGIDLTIAPMRHSRMDWWLASSVIDIDRDYDLFALLGYVARRPSIQSLCHPKPLPVGKRLDWYMDEGIKRVTEDPYGTPLTYILADETRAIDVPKLVLSDWNRAVLGMLQAIDPETPVVLYWR